MQNINLIFFARPGDNFVPFGILLTCAKVESTCTSITCATQQSEFSLINIGVNSDSPAHQPETGPGLTSLARAMVMSGQPIRVSEAQSLLAMVSQSHPGPWLC